MPNHRPGEDGLPAPLFCRETRTIRTKAGAVRLGPVSWSVLVRLWCADGGSVGVDVLREAWLINGRDPPTEVDFNVVLSRLRRVLGDLTIYRIHRQRGGPCWLTKPVGAEATPPEPARSRQDHGDGCRYIGHDGKACGAERREGSSYCADHHARCHLTPQQAAKRHREFAALAEAVGGRMAARMLRRNVELRDLREIERRMR